MIDNEIKWPIKLLNWLNFKNKFKEEIENFILELNTDIEF